MAASSDEMRRMLESVRKVIRARTVDPTTTAAAAAAATASVAEQSGETRGTTATRPSAASSAAAAQLVRTAQNSSAALNARDNEGEFARYYHRLLLSFVEDKTKYELELPNLSGFDRLVVHALAEKCNLSHQSVGEGAQRVLRLKKDVLFFHQPDAARHVDVDELVAKTTSKESKYHLRRVHAPDPATLAVGDVGSYADDDAARKIARLRRATDEYRHATEMGYTHEQLLAAERAATADADDDDGADDGEARALLRVEDILRRPLDDNNDNDDYAATRDERQADATSTRRRVHEAVTSASSTTSTQALASAHDVVMSSSSSVAAAKKVYDEVCRSCGTRARVDYDVGTWTCSKYCATCLRQTIWTLLEVTATTTTHAEEAGSGGGVVARRGGGDTTTAHAKRARDDADAQLPVPTRQRVPEEIDKDDDDTIHAHAVTCNNNNNNDDDDAAITVEDAVEMAAMNDFSVEDMNWIRRFAARHTAQLSRHIVFCIDFADLSDLRIFRRYEQQQQRRRLAAAATTNNDDDELPVYYVVVTEVAAMQLRVTALLQRVIAAAFRASVAATTSTAVTAQDSEDDDDDVVLRRAAGHAAVAFRNVSVYGVECTAVCQLRAYATTVTTTNTATVTTRAATANDCSSSATTTQHLRIDAAALHGLQRHYGARHCALAHTLDEALQCVSSANT